MKKFNPQTLVGLMLIAILAYYGWRLSKTVSMLARRPQME
jgi:hypothetical protein